MTLALILMLSLMAIELLRFIQPRLTLSRELVETSVLVKAADAGIGYARKMVAGQYELSLEGADNLPVFFCLDNPVFSDESVFFLDDVQVTVLIEDEERRFPLSFLAEKVAVETPEGAEATVEGADNNDSYEPEKTYIIREEGFRAFERLMAELGIPEGWREEASHSLADWIEAPEFSRRAFGAGASYYRISGYEPRGGLPGSLGELSYIRGFTSEVREEILPFISPFAQTVNINTASPEVIRSLVRPGSDLDIKFLLASRPFESFAEINEKTGRDFGRVLLPGMAEKIEVTSSIFSVLSTAAGAGGRQVSVRAVFEVTEAENAVPVQEENDMPGEIDGEQERSVKTRLIYWNRLPTENGNPLSLPE